MSLKTPSIDELERSLQIDEDDLEGNCRTQPTLYYEVSKMLALCTSKRDAAKQELAEIEAQEDARLRKIASKKEERTTEGEFKAAIKSSAAVQDAVAVHLKYASQVGQLQALKEAFQQRSYALSHLVDLHINMYYGESATNRTINSVRDAKANAARVQLRERRMKERDQ